MFHVNNVSINSESREKYGDEWRVPFPSGVFLLPPTRGLLTPDFE